MPEPMSHPPAPAVAAHEAFRKFSQRISHMVGSPYAFGVAVVVVLMWVATGPAFGFSHDWALFIHTVTAIATFLVVFILQNTQNRDNRTIQLKLDELILQLQGPRNAFAALESMPEAELRAVEQEARELRELVVAELEGAPTDAPT